MKNKLYTIPIALFAAATVSVSGKNIKYSTQQPNIIVLLLDDVGYGDFGCYGHPVIRTPNIDNLAKQGVRFTSFMVASTSTPTRTQLMTGRYMSSIVFGGSTGPGGKGGLPDSIVTLAQGLKNVGYNTGMFGKWHLGQQDKFLPVNKGFDKWLGTAYSNDFRKPWVQTDVPLGLYKGTKIVEYPLNQPVLTNRYTEGAIKFIEENSNKNQPFFLYVAYNMAHLPIYTTNEFLGQSEAGLYGDVIANLDWSVGRILQALSDNNADENTVVFLASDNGAWMDAPDRMFLKEHNKPWHQGTAGLLRGSKATSYEGGCRVPAMIRWPNKISNNRVTSELIAMLDIYSTLLMIGGSKLPNYPVHGFDLTSFLTSEIEKSPRNEYAYGENTLQAMRVGDWKLMIREEDGEPELFNLQLDPSERYNRANEKHEIVHQIYEKMVQFANELSVNVAESNITSE